MADTPPTSLTLLERLRANDESAWGRVVYLYRPLILHWCRRSGVTGGDADDVSQEVFAAVAAGIERFRREQAGDTFRGWMRGITRFKLLHHHERRRDQPVAQGGTDHQQLLNQHAADALGDPDPADEERSLYHRALELVRDEFEPATWQAFWRTAVDGLTAPDAAADLGTTPAAVRQAKSRVVRRIREALGDVLD